MDPHRIIQTLQASLQSEQQSEAEKLLVEMHKIIGFGPTLLQIVLEQSLDLSVRQAGAVFLKNLILKSWKKREPLTPEEPIPFQIHENDRENLRSLIVPAVASSVIPIQSILQVAVGRIVKCDFPARYPQFTEQVAEYLSSDDFLKFHGALLCLYSLVQAYEHRSSDKRPLPETMTGFLTILYQRMCTMITDISEKSLTLQKLTLKIFYRYTDTFFQATTLNEQWVTEWHGLLCSVLGSFDGLNDDADSVYWKRQKWAARILYCWFTTYGSPGNVQKKYETFAGWYLKSFTTQVLSTLFKICDLYRQQTFISPKVLAETLSYIAAALCHSFSWVFMQPHFDTLLQDIILPLLSHTTEIAALWEEDPLEYIRYNTTMYVSMHNPTDAAAMLVKDACTKRKGILDKSMQYCIQVLNSDAKPEIKDGALHLVGTVHDVLLKNKMYKQQLENFLTVHVLPLLETPQGFRRARACWLLEKLSKTKFNNVQIIGQAAMACRHLMKVDTDLPVRVAAANAVFSLIKHQANVKQLMSAHLPELVLELLKLLRSTEFDDLNSLLRDIMISYSTEIQPIALEILQQLSGTFFQLVGLMENGEADPYKEVDDSGDLLYNEEKEYQSLVATDIMENIESLMSIVEDNTELAGPCEAIIVQLVRGIFNKKISDFYDEAFALAWSMTGTSISPLKWSVFDWLYQAYESDASDCFASMMPALHNYVTVDPKTFAASPERVKMLVSMCGKALQNDEEQSTEGVHAAKMLEILTINFRGQLEHFMPEFVELALTRLTRPTTFVELRMMCLQVVIAAIVSSAPTVLPILSTHMWPETQTPIIEKVLQVWMENIKKFSGLHDRRLCVLGLCTLLSLPTNQRPPAVDAICSQFLPALLQVLNGLKNAYALKKEAEEDDTDSNSDEEEEENTEGAIDDDEDVIDEERSRYLELLTAVKADLGDDSDDEDGEDEDDDDEFEADSALEDFDTELDKEESEMDEYVTFYQLMTSMETQDALWYQRLVAPLTDSQKTEFKAVAEIALKCIQQKQSIQIEKAGGYTFQQTDVPNSFNFSGDPPPEA